MDAFVARKRPASAIEITDKNLPILPFSLHEPSSPPAMKTKIALRPTSNGSEKAPRRRRLLLGKSPAGAGSLLVEQEGLGDGIKECLALEKYEMDMDVQFFISLATRPPDLTSRIRREYPSRGGGRAREQRCWRVIRSLENQERESIYHSSFREDVRGIISQEGRNSLDIRMIVYGRIREIAEGIDSLKSTPRPLCHSYSHRILLSTLARSRLVNRKNTLMFSSSPHPPRAEHCECYRNCYEPVHPELRRDNYATPNLGLEE